MNLDILYITVVITVVEIDLVTGAETTSEYVGSATTPEELASLLGPLEAN